jgi:hypothetical protein
VLWVHIFVADLVQDPNFHVNADPDPDPDWHQYDADIHADPNPSFTHVGKCDFFAGILYTLSLYDRYLYVRSLWKRHM